MAASIPILRNLDLMRNPRARHCEEPKATRQSIFGRLPPDASSVGSEGRPARWIAASLRSSQ